MTTTAFSHNTALVIGLLAVVLFGAGPVAVSAQTPPEVQLTAGTAGPRPVESLTEHSIVRDYKAAWQTLAQASESSSPALLDAYFVGNAKTTLTGGLSGQKKTGIRVRYLNQIHNLKAMFYAPEGDVMELQDAAEYQLQIMSDDKVLHDEHVVVQYLVFMTPAADRWVIRQLQALPAL